MGSHRAESWLYWWWQGKPIDLLEHWAIVEADMQREYSISLEESISTMSWRRFKVLLKGLSQNSLWVIISQNTKKVIEDPIEAERAVDRIW